MHGNGLVKMCSDLDESKLSSQNNRIEHMQSKSSKIYTRDVFNACVHSFEAFVRTIYKCFFFLFCLGWSSFVQLTIRSMNVFTIESLAKCLFHKCVSKCGVVLLAAASDSGSNFGPDSENGITFCILRHNIHTKR